MFVPMYLFRTLIGRSVSAGVYSAFAHNGAHLSPYVSSNMCKRRADEQTLTEMRDAGISIDLEPNACAAVVLYSPAVRYRLDDRQAPPALQSGLRAGFRQHIEAMARIAYPPTH